jgi:transposase
MYKSKDDMLINADVNGAYNILRKVFPTAFSNKSLKDNGIVNAPTCPVSLIVA